MRSRITASVGGKLIGRTSRTIYDAYGSPPDPQTFGAVGLDRAGRPLYISLGGPVANGPYDIDLTRNAPHAVIRPSAPSNPRSDNPFGVAEVRTHPPLLRSRRRHASATIGQPDQQRQQLPFAVAAGGIHDRKLDAFRLLPACCRPPCGMPLPECESAVHASRRYPRGQDLAQHGYGRTNLNVR